MCGRFYVELENDDWEDIAQLMDALNRRMQGKADPPSPKAGEVRPSDTALVLAKTQGGRMLPFSMKWGFAHPGGKGMLINIRSETALEKPCFRQLTLSRRCLIPASWYFEWENSGSGKKKYAIRPSHLPLYMAGLYQREPDQALPTFSILTTEAAPDIAFIHPRMPLIIPPDQREAWLMDNMEEQVSRALRGSVSELHYQAV